MKKDIYDYYRVNVPVNKTDEPVCECVIEKTDTVPAILQAIYSLDPVTRLPTGDVMCFLSSKTSPEVKQFIMDNLMVDVTSQQLPPIPDGLDDDTAFALQRQPDENVDSYRDRVSSFMEQQVNICNMAIENAKRSSSKESSE